MPHLLDIRVVDARREPLDRALEDIRAALSPSGNIVSEAGQKRTKSIFGASLSPEEIVAKICGEVKASGWEAVRKYSAKLDGVNADTYQLRIPAAALREAHAAVDPEFLAAVRYAAKNVREFQAAILHRDVELLRPDGARLTQRYRPLERVGLYFPGGAAAYPSTVVMTVVPAQVAGVRSIAVVSPPTENGAYHPKLLATCHELQVDEVYAVGGAQAIAVLAYGIEGAPKVDKICGPGNLFVALAKRLVYGQVDIDSIAGPSEVLILADDTADAGEVAADLIAQAEHSPGASILVTWSRSLAAQVRVSLESQLETTERAELARASLEKFGALLTVESREEAVRIANQLAPEHLHIQAEAARELADECRHAGAVFVGRYSPVAVGDYIAGPSHVLPTGGTARFARGLTCNDFVRSSSQIEYSKKALAAGAPYLDRLARGEGLTAHAASVLKRLED